MLHLGDDDGHSRAWRWGLVLAAAALIVYAVLELRDMRARVEYLERQAERRFWKSSNARPIPAEESDSDGRDSDERP